MHFCQDFSELALVCAKSRHIGHQQTNQRHICKTLQLVNKTAVLYTSMIWYEKTKHKENKAEHYLYLVPAGALEVAMCNC